MVGLDKELILEIVGAQVVISLAHPVVQDLEIRLQASEEALLEGVQTRVAKTVVN